MPGKSGGMQEAKLTSGLPGLDSVLKGVAAGDNIVWQVEHTDDYLALVRPYVKAYLALGKPVIYFRFASHDELVGDQDGVCVHRLDPGVGFERFVKQVHEVIEDAGVGAIYVFDCISELASEWQSDQALGNFFMLTCPRLYDLETVTYFALIRNSHADFAMGPITETTQYLLDVFRYRGNLYIRPIKVQYRSSSSMNTMHHWCGEAFRPITDSAILAEILAASKWPGLRADRFIGYWRRIFAEAEEVQLLYAAGGCDEQRVDAVFRRLGQMVLSDDRRMLELAYRYLTLDDVLAICDRMIGIGKIGGKAVGMLLARAILRKHDALWREKLETHDSFFIGSDVFYTFLVRNHIWWLRQKQCNPDTFLDDLAPARDLIMQGSFPDYTEKQFVQMLDYFGESPYIVRSSSLLEDHYGNAFAGKYDSVFCVNQGSREERLTEFMNAVRCVYASTMSEVALRYRLRRDLLENDEQMALLVMRVSGAARGRAFYPHVAGVGFSYNPYVWHKDIDPAAGIVRLVFGLGTRAVDRVDDDYTRVVALNAPDKRPEANFDEISEYSQRKVDYLDLDKNRLASAHFIDLVAQSEDVPVDLFAASSPAAEAAGDSRPCVLTFDAFLRETPFVPDMRLMLKTLESAYDYPVDVEFSLNVRDDGEYNINLLQCRPLQVQGTEQIELPEMLAPPEARIIESSGAVIGISRLATVDRLIYISPEGYAALPIGKRYEVARVIGRINATCEVDSQVMLMGPGRWGTRSPELGIPVHFQEINRVNVLCEIVAMHENLIPDVSLGTHFLNELVEMNILYLALFPKAEQNRINQALVDALPNRLMELVPECAEWSSIIKVADGAALAREGVMQLHADAIRQYVCLYHTDQPMVP